MIAALLLLAAARAWPLTAGELEGQGWAANPRVDDSPPCSPKTRAPIELRLFAKVKELRLTVKNCSGKAVKVLDDAQLQPSRLEFAAKLKPPFDERSREKFDATVRVTSFVTLQPGEERVLADETFSREGEAYAVRWGPFRYEGVPLGQQKVRAALDAFVDSAFDEEAGHKVTLDNAAVGAFKSNEVAVTLP